MKGIPINKATQTAHIIREAIDRGEWTTYLPGERTLAKELIISRACLRQALEILTAEKILSPVERSKRRRILLQGQTQATDSKVIFFTPEPTHRAAPMVLEQLAQLRHHLAKENKQVELLSSPVFKNPQTSDQTMDQLTSAHPHAHWVLHQCPEHIQRWFHQKQIRCTVLGSIFPGITLPHIDIDLYGVSRHATGLLLAKGHQRIGLIRFRSQLAGDKLAIEGVNDAIKAHKNPNIPHPVEMKHNFHVDRLTSALDRLCESTHRPSALVVVNHHHFITTFSHLLSRGLRIPEDISLICLSHDKVLEHFSPSPTCYTTGDRLIRNLTQMIVNSSAQGTCRPGLLVPDLISGKTVGPFQG